MNSTYTKKMQLEEEGSVEVPAFMPPGLARLLYDYTCIRFANGDLDVIDDGFVPMAQTKYGDYFTEALLIHYLPIMCELTGKDLAPTYSYLRRYKRGDNLPKHQDRYSCQYSVTACAGYSYDNDQGRLADPGWKWPLHMEGGKKILQDPGDALVYMGTDYKHWRDALPWGHQVQVHLHYIDKEAEFYPDLELDARYRLGQSDGERDMDKIKKWIEQAKVDGKGFRDKNPLTGES
jgi:hypothetical protein